MKEIDRFAGYLGVDPRELIPCRPGGKQPWVRGYNNPGFGTNWKRRFASPEVQKANLAVLFGRQSRLVGIDIDSQEALALVERLLKDCAHVVTDRGACFIARLDQDVAQTTSGTVIKLKLNGKPAGELRLARCFSVVRGIHPSGRRYRFVPPEVRVVNLEVLVAELKRLGFEVAAMRPPGAPRAQYPTGMDSESQFWASRAKSLGYLAPERDDGTVGTDEFVVTMLTEIRPLPHLAELVVNYFARAVAERDLKIRDGVKRLQLELDCRLKQWASAYGSRVRHPALRAFFRAQPRNMKQDTQSVLFRFLLGKEVRADQANVVHDLVHAFAVRARETGNGWTYESTKALVPMVPPATFSRGVRLAAQLGLLERAENDLPSSRPPQMTAEWKYRATPLALQLTEPCA